MARLHHVKSARKDYPDEGKQEFFDDIIGEIEIADPGL